MQPDFYPYLNAMGVLGIHNSRLHEHIMYVALEHMFQVFKTLYCYQLRYALLLADYPSLVHQLG